MTKDYGDVRVLLNIDLTDRSYRYSDRAGLAHKFSTSTDGRVIVEDDVVLYKGAIVNRNSISNSISVKGNRPSVGNVNIELFNEDDLHLGNSPVALESGIASLYLVRGNMYDEVLASITGRIDGLKWDWSKISFRILTEDENTFRNVPTIIFNERTFQTRVMLGNPEITPSSSMSMRLVAWNHVATLDSQYAKYVNHPALAGHTDDYWVGARVDVVDAEGELADPESDNFAIGEFAIAVDSEDDWVRLPTVLDRYFLYTMIDDNLRLNTAPVSAPYEMRDVINNTMKNVINSATVDLQDGGFEIPIATSPWFYSTWSWDSVNKRAFTSGTGTSFLRQNVSTNPAFNMVVGVKYKLKFEVVSFSSTSGTSFLRVSLGAGTNSGTDINAAGWYELELEGGTGPEVGFYDSVGDISCAIDNVSIEPRSSATLMVTRRPAPENADSIGRPLPIVYGAVDKMWAVWAISSKSTRQNSLSAGDDVYVIAGHKIYDKSPSEILVYYGLDENANSMLVKPGIIDYVPNPLPKSISEIDRWHESGYDLRDPADPTKNTTPLHKLVEITTNDGEVVTAVKLRGDEYDGWFTTNDGDMPIINGKPQFPIRYGLGSSKVYVSFRGHYDIDGSITGTPEGLIEHPIDIIKHFLLNYTNIDGDTTKIDDQSFADAKSRLQDWKLGVAITDVVNGEEIIERIAKQSKSTWLWKDGKIHMKVFDLDNKTPSFKLEEKKHFTGKQSWSRPPLSEVYNDFTFKYAYNGITDKYDGVIRRNKSNDQPCRDSYAVYNTVRSYEEILLPDVVDSFTANKIADHYVAMLALARTTFKTGLRLDEDTYGLAPGDVVDVTLSDGTETTYLTLSIAADRQKLQSVFLELI